ncbi:uncharacterized protein [Malus domestica]|uniref:uncharacterized protein n=1 Tax=Malus domestica TaxID=3750 RepID=UPI003974A764
MEQKKRSILGDHRSEQTAGHLNPMYSREKGNVEVADPKANKLSTGTSSDFEREPTFWKLDKSKPNEDESGHHRSLRQLQRTNHGKSFHEPQICASGSPPISRILTYNIKQRQPLGELCARQPGNIPIENSSRRTMCTM